MSSRPLSTLWEPETQRGQAWGSGPHSRLVLTPRTAPETSVPCPQDHTGTLRVTSDFITPTS